MTDDCPGGIAYKVFERLKKKYQPKDGLTDVELQERLTSISMKKDDNPDLLFDQLSTIKNWYNTPNKKVSESQMVAIVMARAPKDYKSLLTAELRANVKAGIETSVDELQEIMVQHHRALFGSGSSKVTDLENKEYTLIGMGDKYN